ncbi:MAG TPA: hypothetical protein VFH45_02790, partial [Acidimicrobiales bacterium]|nr:hypothetical protein [Acidimicrobiales bacterium]
MTEPAPDVLGIAVPVGGRVVVVSDLHLVPDPGPGGASAAAELAQSLNGWDGPGVVVVAGNLFDLWSDPRADLAGALDAHPGLAAALAAFGGRPARRLVVIPGCRDARLAWDERLRRTVVGRLGAEVALAVDLEVETGSGPRRVRIEAGDQLDPRFRRRRPEPAESPLGEHVATELVPALGDRPWLKGGLDLADASALPRFVASRFFYRRVARSTWWLLPPLLAALALKLPITYAFVRHPSRVVSGSGWEHHVGLVLATTVVDIAALAVILLIVARRFLNG